MRPGQKTLPRDLKEQPLEAGRGKPRGLAGDKTKKETSPKALNESHHRESTSDGRPKAGARRRRIRESKMLPRGSIVKRN